MSGLDGGFSAVNYVSPNTLNLATLLGNFPASAGLVGNYAVVSDLFGTTNEVMRCGSTNVSGTMQYYWRPQRTDYASTLATTGGTLSLAPLFQSPVIFLSGTLASSLTVNLLTTNAWPGATFSVVNNTVLGVSTVSLNGLAGGILTLAGGGAKYVAYYDGTAWKGYT